MSLYVGDRAPKAIPISITTTTVDATTITAIKLRGRRPDGSIFEWDCTPTSSTTTKALASYTLASDGSDLPVSGIYVARAWCYDVTDALIFDTDEIALPYVNAERVTPP